jgi:hypothetical protein
MAVESVEQMSPAERAVLSRKINQGIGLARQIEEAEEKLRAIKGEVYGMVGGPGKVKSSKGLVEIRKNEQITLPSNEDTREAIVELVGQRYNDLVEEEMKLKPTSAFRRIVTAPGPAEQHLAGELLKIAKVQEVVSVRFIGEG